MSARSPDAFDPLEATIDELHAAMTDGRLTAEALVECYLERIAAYDGELHAILAVNDGAIDRGRRLDARFERDGMVGSLHGIPVILKDNQDTHDMPTTAGSVTLRDSTPPRDAFIVERLREAGAIVLAKANLQEFSFGINTISSLGGETRNAYDVDRRPSGSSGGTAAAIAANLGAIGTGTDTCSSVRSPPAFHALVGVRPTRGLVSRTGIVPISETQDTAGPITRTVEDAARMLEVMAGYDSADPVTASGVGQLPSGGYVTDLEAASLDGARIGVARQFFGLQNAANGSEAAAASVTTVVEHALETMASRGATLVDPLDVVDRNALLSARLVTHEFARDFDAYLSERRPDATYSSLTEIIRTGEVATAVATRFEEGRILDIDGHSLDENVGYLRRFRRRERLRETILALMADHDLDALVYPPSTIPPVRIPAFQPFDEMNCELAAHTGLPAIVVPAGFTDDHLPVGLELLGRPFAEPQLFELAAVIERVVDGRRPPERFGPLE